MQFGIISCENVVFKLLIGRGVNSHLNKQIKGLKPQKLFSIPNHELKLVAIVWDDAGW